MKVLTFILFSVGVLVTTMCIAILKQMYNAKRKYNEECEKQQGDHMNASNSQKGFSKKEGEYVKCEEL